MQKVRLPSSIYLEYQGCVKSGNSFFDKSKAYIYCTDKEKNLIASLVNLWMVREYPGKDDIVYSPPLALSTINTGDKKTTENFVLFLSLRFRDAKRVERGWAQEACSRWERREKIAIKETVA